MTKKEAKKIYRLIKKLIEAELADSWKGGGHPADAFFIEAELKLARLKLVTELERHIER